MRYRVIKKYDAFWPQWQRWFLWHYFLDQKGEKICCKYLTDAERVCYDELDKEKQERQRKQTVFYCD